MIKLRFGPDDVARCRFTLSPLWETLAAVRTLSDRGQQRHQRPWLAATREAAERLDLTLLHGLNPTRGYVPDFLSPAPERPLVSFAGELARLRRTPLERVRIELERSFSERPPQERPAGAEFLLQDLATTLDRLVSTLEEAWHALVAPSWPAVRQVLDDDIRHHSQQLADGGLERLFSALHPRLRWETGCLQVRKAPAGDRDLAGAGLVLMPSVYTWPALVVILDPPWQPTIVYPARGIDRLWASAPSPSDALARLLGITRAALLLDLDRGASTTALAHRHGLSPGTVSAHLTTLRDAGLVEGKRRRHEVLYGRTALGEALAAPAGRRPDRGASPGPATSTERPG